MVIVAHARRVALADQEAQAAVAADEADTSRIGRRGPVATRTFLIPYICIAAIHENRVSCHHSCSVASEVKDRRSDLVRFRGSAERHALHHLTEVGFCIACSSMVDLVKVGETPFTVIL